MSLRERLDAVRPDGGRALEHLPGDWGPPVLGHTTHILRDQVAFNREMHARFGPVFRARSFLERYVMLLGPEANRLVLQDRERVFSTRLGWDYVLGSIFARGLLLRDFDEHLAHRRAMMEAFRPAALRGYVGRMGPPIARAAERWARTARMRAYADVERLTLELAAEVFLGVSLGERAKLVQREFHALTRVAAAIVRAPVPGGLYARARVARARIERVVSELVVERRARPGTDLLSILCRAELEGQPLTDREIVDHLVFILSAAHDTTTSAVSSALRLLARHPEPLATLCDESRDRVDAHVDLDGLSALPFGDRVILEALRLFPPVTALPRRTLREVEVLGHRIPAGTTLYLSPPFTHRMAELHPDPDRFDPSRFAGGGEDALSRTFAFIPFGGGPHKCIGMHFARAQARLILFHLMRRASPSLPPWHPRGSRWLPVPAPLVDTPIELRRHGHSVSGVRSQS